MGKAGFAPSGNKKVQRWRCSKCNRVTTKGEDSSNNHNRVVVDFNDLEYAQLKVRSIKAKSNVSEYLRSLAFREH